MSTINFNPLITTNFQGGFSTESAGLVQGVAFDDPTVRNLLSGGVLGNAETLPMWGGVGIFEDVNPVAAFSRTLGGVVGRATILTSLTGFSVFNQATNWVQTPQSPVPLAASGMTVPFYRFGSNARIAVKVDPALVSLEGGLITQQVSWDFTGQQLAPFNAAWAANVITAATWASTSGGQVTFTTTTSHGVAVGADFAISGMTPAGYNGVFKAITGTTGSTLVAALATNPGASTTQGTLLAGGGALNCRVLQVDTGNSKTVAYDPVTGFATWVNNGACAVILI